MKLLQQGLGRRRGNELTPPGGGSSLGLLRKFPAAPEAYLLLIIVTRASILMCVPPLRVHLAGQVLENDDQVEGGGRIKA